MKPDLETIYQVVTVKAIIHISDFVMFKHTVSIYQAVFAFTVGLPNSCIFLKNPVSLKSCAGISLLENHAGGGGGGEFTFYVAGLLRFSSLKPKFPSKCFARGELPLQTLRPSANNDTKYCLFMN